MPTSPASVATSASSSSTRSSIRWRSTSCRRCSHTSSATSACATCRCGSPSRSRRHSQVSPCSPGSATQPWFQPALGVPAGGPHTLLLLFVLAAPVFLFPLRPLSAWLSRRHEFAADRFAAQHADAGALADALVKLYRDNATTLTPDPLYAAFHASHPPALARIARLAPERAGMTAAACSRAAWSRATAATRASRTIRAGAFTAGCRDGASPSSAATAFAGALRAPKAARASSSKCCRATRVLARIDARGVAEPVAANLTQLVAVVAPGAGAGFRALRPLPRRRGMERPRRPASSRTRATCPDRRRRARPAARGLRAHRLRRCSRQQAAGGWRRRARGAPRRRDERAGRAVRASARAR